ncbi:DsbA family protein [Phenylobacterium sp.]|uniref:DsbA family protein n=1 Tax=Phenylobacterium sp. TaxID=1871053 RepID=UPI001206DCF1|nr:DsbA family protein [Phenylobacterium sp.]THD64418.1 MAG: DsbA family protein [Phenylobacterium sp.]
MPTRRALVILSAVLAAGGVGLGAAQAAPTISPDDMSLGNPKAKVQVVEYASMACPHCGHFNEAIFAPFKAKWIDTGKAHYTLKEMLTEPVQVAAAGFMIARCAGPDKYFTVVDQVFRSQSRWVQGNIKPIFQEIAAANGLDEARFNACLSDQTAAEAIAKRAQNASDQDGVNSTPTIFINGKKLDNLPQTPAEMDAAIAAALKGGR